MNALTRDVLFGIAMLLASAVAGWFAFGYAPDSSWFPRVLSVFLGLVALVLFVRSLGRDGEGLEVGGQLQSALIVFGACVAYAVAIQFLSFEIVNFVFLAGAMYALGQRNPLVIVGVSLATMLLVKLLFFAMLDVPRPQGVWY